ncbi:MAG: alginate export family protein [Gammaproteobacteria bacterium]
MNRNTGSVIVLLAACMSSPLMAAETLGEAFSETKYIMNWRVRYEFVDQDGFDKDAKALTSRVRAGFESGELAKTRLLAEVVGNAEINSKFNSTTNGQTDYPVVADPGGFAEINRFAIINNSLDKTALTLGRQRLILDDARFVGNVGWRQIEQTFDGLSSHTAGEKFTVDLAYVNQVNRIFGPDSPNGEWNGDIFLLNASRTFGFGKLTAFAYGLEIDEAAAASTDTVGLRLKGSRAFGDTTFNYTLSYAQQSEAGLNPNTVDEDYSLLEAGFARGKFSASLGYELLSGNGTTAFSTPLATLHAFQGWADKFLSTPANGIADSYLKFGYRPGMTGPFDNVSLAAVYHQFDADLGSAAYGDEFDFSISARKDRVTLLLKYAAYAADTFATDTDKVWFQMEYVF